MSTKKINFQKKIFYYCLKLLLTLFLIVSCQVDHSTGQQPEEQKTKTTKTDQIDANTQRITDEETISKEQKRDATKIEILCSGGKIPYKWVWVTYYRWTTWYYSYGGPWWKGKQLYHIKTITTTYYTDGTSSKSDAKYDLQWIKTWNSKGKLTSDTDYTDPANVTINSVSVNPKGRSFVKVGTGEKFSAIVSRSPSDAAAGNKVNWTSSDTSIATIDQNGNVTAKAKGKVTITAKSSEDSSKK